ncbi:MAG: phytoene desaturase family protein [Bacteroidia bacterium]
MSKVVVIGSGFSGLASASFLAQQGLNVTVFEKNAEIGGRARVFGEDGFVFDMGPSWYWMPDVFERYFSEFGKSAKDFYDLKKLDPGFQIIYGENDLLTIPASMTELMDEFERIEKGSSKQLEKFLKEAEFKYNVGMKELVYKPAYSWFEFANLEVLSGVLKSNIFSSVSTYVRKYFKDERLIMLMEFPVLFLGAMPNQIPALYSLMNYSALVQGTYYPMGGMCKIIEGMKELAESLGVEIKTSEAINSIDVVDGKVKGVKTDLGQYETDGVIASADYHHVEQKLLPTELRNYDETYWKKKTFAPSSLIFYIGVNKKIGKLLHHNLFFDADFSQHSKDIYEKPQWTKEPLFYVCCPSKTDDSVAPEGMENLFVLIPIATGLEDNDEIRESYFAPIIKRIEKFCGESFLENIIYKKSYCVKNFVNDYNAYGGNAYGLANTLKQTAVLKPSLKNKKVNNLFYTGQLTVPGPGVPPALISGQIAAKELMKQLKNKSNEAVI